VEGVRLGRQYASLRDPGRNRLREPHEALDSAVFELYGFSDQDDPLVQLLALNESMAQEDTEGLTQPRGPGNVGLPNTKRTTSKIEAPAL
jgi:hypothetical protein